MYSANHSWIKLTPLGGANTVTGSCYLITVTLEKSERNYMVDCGLFTEKEAGKLNTNIADVVSKVNAIFVTHAHVDHIGRLPYAYKLGYKGPIYSTEPVRALSSIMLRDSANIQEQAYLEFLRRSRLRNKKFNEAIGLEPLYTICDAEQVMDQFVTVSRNKTIKVDNCLEVCFYNAGHGLGSASIMLTFNNGRETYKLYFSGDVGQNNPILKQRRDSLKKDVDFVVMETTYAGKYHAKRRESWNELRELVAKTISKGGNVIFPAFAVGRTQELLYLYYKDMMENDDWIAKLLRRTSVFVDSNMAVLATQEFGKYEKEFNKSVRRVMFGERRSPFSFPQLTLVNNATDSKELTRHNNNYVVFSAAGMCNAGRVLYHLEKDLPNPKSAIIFTGYQAEGTLGRQIIDGSKQVRIGGKPIMVRAQIASINAFSAHVDQKGLIKWLGKIEEGYTLFLGHGEPEAQGIFKDELVERGLIAKKNVEVMVAGRCYRLYKGGYEVEKINTDFVPKTQEVHYDVVKMNEIKRIRDFINLTPTTCLDSETIKLIAALDSRLSREFKKAKKARKLQSKPNRRYSKVCRK